MKRVACPSKSRASLGEELGAEVFGGGNAGVVKELQALSRWGGRNLGGAAKLDEGLWCWRHELEASMKF